MKTYYTAVIHKDEDSDFGVMFPEVEGCFSAGITLEEALENAKEALENYLRWNIEDKMPLPKRMCEKEIDDFLDSEDLRIGLFKIVNIGAEISLKP